MSLSASDVTSGASRAAPRGARTRRASVRAALLSAALLCSALVHGQTPGGGPIVIPGPGEKNPAAAFAMAASAGMQNPASAPPASRTAAPPANTRASGSIVIPGPGERAAAGTLGSAPAPLPRVSVAATVRPVMPVVVASAPDGSRRAMRARPVAANLPASDASFDSLASRGEPPQLGAGARQVNANRAASSPAPQTLQAAQSASGALAPAAAPAAPAVPAGQQDGESIRRAALAFLQQQAAGLPGKIGITVAPAFPRGLAACATLEPFMPAGTRLWGRTTVGVRCSGERPWTLYLQARITLQATYYVAARQIAPGETLSAADLVARDGDLTALPQAVITDPSQAVGSVALARVSAGLPLRQAMLKSASSVTIGQTVRIVALGQGFAISSEGSVMNNAAPGQQVRVKTAAGQIITGIVKDASTVEIQL
jgi:flagellar basal body P-ring formation protein FlgA